MAVITIDFMNVNILPLFPTPVLSYEVEMGEVEKSFLLNQYPDNVVVNTGNLTSSDTRILERAEVAGLKEKLLFLINDAFIRINNPLYGCELYITQSWLNFSVRGQEHPFHYHANSMYSAILYLQVSEEDCITFYNPNYNVNYDISSTNYDLFNCKCWSLKVKDGLLLVFPSTLGHSVPRVKHDGMRVSLSFNTYIRGEIGSPESLNHLVL